MLSRKRAGIGLLCLLLLAAPVLSAQAQETAGAHGAAAAEEEGSSDRIWQEVSSNRHTQYVPQEEAESLLTTDGYEKKLDNGILSVWYEEKTQSIRVEDARTGYVWGCSLEDEAYGLNKGWRARANSLCYITYYDIMGKEESTGLSEGDFDVQFQWEKESAVCYVSSKKLGISFAFGIELDGPSLRFSVDDSSIQETGKSRLGSLSFVQFFGSVYEDSIPGYALAPDGSGALIRFQRSRAYNSAYNKKVYGYDLSMEQSNVLSNLNGNRNDDYATEEYGLSFPVWGMVHGENQNAFLATVDSGEQYAQISIVPAGAEAENVHFTRAYATFIYHAAYNEKVSNSQTVEVVSEERNAVNAELTYTFLTGADANYSGMARCYRQMLIEQGRLPQPEAPAGTAGADAGIPVLLNVIGAEVKEGFLSNTLAELTSAEEAQAILDRLQEEGISNVTFLLSGWIKGGYNGADFGDLRVEKKVGGWDELEELRDRVEGQGGSFALTLNAMTANEDQINPNQEAALSTILEPVRETVPNPSLMYPDTYHINHTLSAELIERAGKELSGYGLMLEGAGKYLVSDFTVGDEANRREVEAELTQAVGSLSQDVILDAPNLYMLPYAEAVAGLPVSGSQYIYETDSVPFAQMVLRGSVDYYSPYSNQGFYTQASILKMIEYGSYPSFMVMEADNFDLYNTPLENYFSLYFGDWEERIVQICRQVGEALAPVEGASILSHTAVGEGVYRVEYDNGVAVWVNYGEDAYEAEGAVTVPGGGYFVEEQVR